MTVAELLGILSARNPGEEVLVHATTRDGAIAVCDVTGHMAVGDEDVGIVLVAECVTEPLPIA